MSVFTLIQNFISIVILVVLSMGCIFSVSTAMGATYYVSSNGDNNAPGTLEAPFKTIQHAADLVNPGDTVVVQDGIYSGNSENLVTIKRSGTADAWITFRSENKWGAILDGSHLEHSCVSFGQVSYIIVEGFEIRNAPWSGLWSNAGAKHIVVRGKPCSSHREPRD